MANPRFLIQRIKDKYTLDIPFPFILFCVFYFAQMHYKKHLLFEKFSTDAEKEKLQLFILEYLGTASDLQNYLWLGVIVHVLVIAIGISLIRKKVKAGYWIFVGFLLFYMGFTTALWPILLRL